MIRVKNNLKKQKQKQHTYKLNLRRWAFSDQKLNILTMTIAGLLIGLQLILGRFVYFNLVVMKIGFDFVFFSIYGILFGALLGGFVAIMGDTFLLLIRGTIGEWMWQYAIIPIFITIITSTIKLLLFDKKGKAWLLSIFSIFLITDAASLFTILINQTNNYYKFNDNVVAEQEMTEIWIWVSFSILVLVQMIMSFMYLMKKRKYIKKGINIFTLFLLISVLINWIWGPYAFVSYLNKFMGYNYTLKDHYWIYLIPRIIKTIPEVIIWSFFGYSIFEVTYCMFKKIMQNKWM